MGTSKNAAEFAEKCARHAALMDRDNSLAINRAANVYKQTILGELKEEIGPELKLSRWKWNGTTYRPLKLGVGYDVKGKINATAIIKARPPGPWKVVEYGAAPHKILPRKKRKLSRLKFGSDPTFPRSVTTWQTRGKRVFARGARIAQSRAIDVFTAVRRQEFVKGW